MSEPIPMKLNSLPMTESRVARPSTYAYADERWPGSIRLIVILGLSAVLWTPIISLAVWALA